MKPQQVLEIFETAQKRTEPKSIVILRVFVAILFLGILIGYMYVQIGNVDNILIYILYMLMKLLKIL
jgi:hypothetical protein